MIAETSVQELVREITACRACGSGNLEVVLDLGVHAVSDFYNTVPADELRAPLTLAMCGACGLVQLTHSVDRDRLYKSYWYRSGLNPSMIAALKDVVDDAMSQVTLETNDSVLDIGSNDSTLLAQYPPRVHTVGIEPSELGLTHSRRHHIYHTYYPLPSEWWLAAFSPFKIITSVAMYYDLDRPREFVSAITQDLHPEGAWCNQMMDLERMMVANAVDNICHEHVGYWRYEDFYRIVQAHDLKIVHGSRNLVNGGSVRLMMKHGSMPEIPPNISYRSAFVSWARELEKLKGQCVDFLEACRANGKTVLGLGASTKGSTLAQYYGITRDLLPAIGERNLDKVGKVTAGTHIPIISESEMRERKPDYLLVFPWHFLGNLLEREKELRDGGTRFVVPLPTFRIV